MRKNKGDVTYFLEKEGDNYRLTKRIKARTNVKIGNKTTKITLYDAVLNENELQHIDFTCSGLREDDEMPVKNLIKEFMLNETR
ncbi:hypothetical protein U4Z66_20605 [Escherichia coli]|uniref:hypothetical protein n=1 Tax=Enterobacteriaceae TaxID=543 RepID=UPI00044AB226|nr:MULTISPECIES: hypothetical protein [Enterobacteriaceae]EAU8632654.1 hypothetical protein [Salmonella enterica]ECM3670842.1 hypothetical protein [Salmonella enterica subsp. enterica serovar Newport]HAX5537699.1 hypothetical protein [Escherichia coli O157]EBL0387944.1 hypothetical protein [Salmonella enterica]ECS0420237.1 hypothetical protein [Salmonella enterica]